MNHTKEAPLACGLLVQICVDARHLSVENYFHQSDMYLTSIAFFGFLCWKVLITIAAYKVVACYYKIYRV